MSRTLTVDLDSGVLELAEQAAQARHMTLPEVVAHQLRVAEGMGAFLRGRF